MGSKAASLDGLGVGGIDGGKVISPSSITS